MKDNSKINPPTEDDIREMMASEEAGDSAAVTATDAEAPPAVSAEGEAVPTPTVGAILSAARQAQGLSIDDVARTLRLSRRQIEGLETNQFSLLPGPTFVRGFIRNYARLVQLDPDQAIHLYNELNFRERPQVIPNSHRQLSFAEERVVKRPFFEEARRPWPKYGIGLAVIAVLLGLALYETLRDDDAPAAMGTAQVTGESPKVPDSSGQVVQPLSLPPPQSAEPAVQATAATPALPATASASAAGGKLLHFGFTGDSWVEVKDKDGRILSSQLNRAGGDLVVQGLAPFSLKVGNASHVKLSYNDKPVDLTPFIRNEVASLTLE